MPQERLPTIGGQVTRAEVFIKMIDHIDQVLDLTATMAHLHNTEGNDMDKLLAKGWLGMHQMIKMMRHQLVQLAKNKLS